VHNETNVVLKMRIQIGCIQLGKQFRNIWD